jgi:lysophospholipase L1-like esterase
LLVLLSNAWGTEPDLRNKRVMVLGDSITRAHTWVSIVDYHLQNSYPQDRIDIIGVGLASETASGLSEEAHSYPRPCIHERLGRLLDMIKPQVVIACYGMNDGIYHPLHPERLSAYQNGMERLIARSRSAGVDRIILMTPPPFDPVSAAANGKDVLGPGQGAAYSYKQPYEDYDDVMTAYGKWLLTLDNGEDIIVADVHKVVASYWKKQRSVDPDFSLNQDGIHPGFTGHLLMADAVLDRIGMKVDDSDISRQEQSIRKDPMFNLIDQRSRLRGDAWRKRAGYIRNKAQTMTQVDDIEAQVKQAAALQKQIDEMRAIR